MATDRVLLLSALEVMVTLVLVTYQTSKTKIWGYVGWAAGWLSGWPLSIEPPCRDHTMVGSFPWKPTD